MVASNDLEKSKAFYDQVLGTPGIAPGQVDRHLDGRQRVRYPSPGGVFAVTAPINGNATGADGGTIGLAAASAEQVKAWHEPGLAAGGASIGDPPGVRETATAKLFIAYLRDSDGNKICALRRMG